MLRKTERMGVIALSIRAESGHLQGRCIALIMEPVHAIIIGDPTKTSLYLVSHNRLCISVRHGYGGRCLDRGFSCEVVQDRA